MIEGGFFVGPHAVRAFQRRIAPLPYEEARTAILEGLRLTRSRPVPSRSEPGTYLIRVRRPYSFRAVIGPGEGPYPAVRTILKSGSGRGGRRHRRRAAERRGTA